MSFRSILQDVRDGIGSISRRGLDRKLSHSLRCRSQSAVYDSNYKNTAVLQQSPWANMPAELLRDVLMRIEESEGTWPARKHVVACAGVCRSWRLIAKDIVKTPQLCGKLTFPLSLKQFTKNNSTAARSNIDCCNFLGEQCIPLVHYKSRFFKENRRGIKSQALAENGKFLLAARKFRRAASADYVISLDAEDMSRGSNTYIGKLRSNFLGTKFTIYDSQPPHSGAVASTSRAGRRVGSRQVSPKVPAGSYVVAHIAYELNVLGTRGPRRMQCTMDSIPTSAMEIEGSAPTPTECPILSLDSLASFPHFGSKSGVIDSSSFSGPIINGNFKEGPLVLKNKSPRWHEQLQCWCLNFRGRVTVASVKNFQLVSATEPTQPVSQSDHDKVILQFGKVGRDMFTMDYRYPLSAFQAFAICLSSFDTKLACE